MRNETLRRWNRLHATPFFSPKYPMDSVVRWSFRNFPRERSSEFNLLDVGSGMGRHAIFWAKEGYNATATDVSPLAKSQVIDWARKENLELEAIVAPADALPFMDESFDGVLSYGVLYYLPYEQMRQGIKEMYRVLRPGGKAFVMIKSDADSRCEGATRLDRFSYQVGALMAGAYWKAEVGMVLTLCDKAALEESFCEFSEIVIDRSTVTSCNGSIIDDDFLIQLTK